MSPLLSDFLQKIRLAFGEWISPTQNPFLARARRIENRGLGMGRPILGALGVGLFIAWCAWESRVFSDSRLSDDLGGDRLNFLILASLSVIFGFGIAFSRARGVSQLWVEWVRGRIGDISQLPRAPENLVWLLSAPASIWGLIFCSLSLPAIVFGLGRGFLNGRDVLGLLCLAIFGCCDLPTWNLALWQSRIEGKKAAATTSQKTFWLAPELAKSWSGITTLATVASAIFLINPVIFGALGAAFFQDLAPEIRRFLPFPWTNWPLVTARFLTYPQPFFGWALPPILFLTPLWVLLLVRRGLRLGALLASRSDFWTLARQKLWFDATRTLRITLLIAGVGFLSPGAWNGWLRLWRAGGPTLPDETALLWALAIPTGFLAASGVWRAILENDDWRAQGWAKMRGPIAKKVARPLIWALAIAVLTPILCGRNPFPSFWQIWPAILAIGGVWFLAQGSLWPIFQLSNPQKSQKNDFAHIAGHLRRRTISRSADFSPSNNGWATVFHAGWCYGFVALALTFGIAPGELTTLPWCLISPWTLWLALRDAATPTSGLFWTAIGVHGLLGWLFWNEAHAYLRALKPTPKAQNLATNSNLETEAAWTGLDWKPQKVAVAALKNVPQKSARVPLPTPDPAQSKFLQSLAKWNNPLLVLETRRLMRDQNWTSQWLLWAVLTPPIALGAALYFSWGPVMILLDGATICFGMVAALMLITTLVAVGGLDNLYDRDRLDGSLHALFLTPLSEREILAGKIGPSLIRLIPTLGAQFLALLLLAITAVFAGQSAFVPLAFAAPFFGASLGLRNAFLFHLAATMTRKVGRAGWLAVFPFLGLLMAETAFCLVIGAEKGLLAIAVALPILSLTHFLEAAFFGWAGLWFLKRERARF